MIDLPVPIYIEYKNLSPLVSQAEHQKDLIASVIKKIEGQTKLVLEHRPEDQTTKDQLNQNVFWVAKCVICYNILQDNHGIVLSSVKKIAKNNGASADISFDTTDLAGRVSSWKIEIAEIKAIIVHSGKNVKINFTSGNGIAIQSFGKSLKSAGVGDMVRVQVNSWFIKNNNPNSTEIIEAKVIAPNEVEYVGK